MTPDGTVLYPLSAALASIPAPDAQVPDDPLSPATLQFLSELLIEAAGLFWIGAELAILLAMTTALRHLRATPLPPRFSLTSADWRRALWGTLSLILLAALLFGRHWFITPYHAAIQLQAETPPQTPVDAIATIYNTRAHLHLIIWCAFIATWVALEIAIVSSGLKIYRQLLRVLAAALLTIYLSNTSLLMTPLTAYAEPTPEHDTLAQAFQSAYDYDAPVRNAVHLYLRIAGVVWITVEWVAAVVLVLAYRHLRRHFTAEEKPS